MSTRRGGSLENAILRASRTYRRAGVKVVLLKQEPRTANVNGHMEMVGGAPVDFLGAHKERAIAIEAKTTKGKSLALNRLREDQISLMGLLNAAGATVGLVVYFSDLDEVYWASWEALAQFLASPWRQSWPLCWFRANGYLVPHGGEPWEVKFLDEGWHPDRGKALDELEKDRAKPRSAREEEPEPRQSHCSPYVGLTKEQARERLMGAVDEGIKNQTKRPRRQWGRRTG